MSRSLDLILSRLLDFGRSNRVPFLLAGIPATGLVRTCLGIDHRLGQQVIKRLTELGMALVLAE